MKHHNLTVINICLHRGRRHKSIMISKFSGYFIDYFTLTNSHFIRVQQTGFLPPYIKGHWQLNAGTHTSDPFITKNGDGTETGIGHPWETILCLTKDSQVLLLALLSLEQFLPLVTCPIIQGKNKNIYPGKQYSGRTSAFIHVMLQYFLGWKKVSWVCGSP